MFLGTSAVRVWALGSLAYNVMPMVLLPLFNIEGDFLISLSASFHIVFGGHVSIALNITELIERIHD